MAQSGRKFFEDRFNSFGAQIINIKLKQCIRINTLKNVNVLQRIKNLGIKLEKVSLDPGETEKWRKIAGEPIWNEWVDEMNKKGLRGQKVLDTTKRLLKKYE